MKSRFYMTTSDDQFNVWNEKKLKALFKAKLIPKKKVMVIVWWSAVGLMHYRFLNSITAEKYAQEISEIHGKLQHLQLASVNSKGPILLHDST